ncbi:MAG: thioredoxin [Clostridiales bacterium]|jgi:thioredoxin 1|nr:thioredoxin [Clostridiales bacterium]
MGVERLNTSNFKETIANSQIPVIVDFYADWCQPCKRLSPVLEEIATENKGKLSIYKVNTDQDPDLAIEYQVMGIPNIISFKNGQVYKRVVGVAPKEELINLVH